jgi:hypothetical protein
MGRGAVTGDQMFLVVATKNAPTIQARMDEHGLTYHTLRPDTWVVLSAGTAPEPDLGSSSDSAIMQALRRNRFGTGSARTGRSMAEDYSDEGSERFSSGHRRADFNPHTQVHLSELAGVLGALTAKVDRLTADVANLSTKLDAKIEGLGGKIDGLAKEEIRPLREMLVFLRGGLYVGGIVVVLFGGLLWWTVGNKVDLLRDQVLTAAGHTTTPRQ